MNDLPNRDVVIFTEAVQLPADEQADYLARACGGDADLRKKVEAWLQTHGHLGSFLEASPQKASIEAKVESSTGEKAGDRIGRYKLLQQIGEGGWGVVFMAEQEEPVRRKVALKVVKPGMDTKTVIARFEAERQALALMDHPNIAHVFDAGATENGRPYFVMELVRGAKITDYCDQNRLPTAERLELFIQVCNAVQHAHQKGIIHRDIKPSNILVTTSEEGKPLPKVIDFGIAKATTGLRLTDKTLFTAFEMLIGTPAYMSPEQAALTSVDVDTRTDIYSLGVLLYELLTGTTPFDTRELLKAGLDEVRRVIQTQEPVRPSTRLRTMMASDLTLAGQRRQAEPPKLIRSLKGDLDWIVMKALEKNRTRRYQTSTGLAEDIQHYLASDTVSARPPSAFYKLQKVVLRNQLLFAGIGIIVVLLITGLGIATWMLAGENRARREAEADKKIAQMEAAKSHQIKQFLEEMLQGVDPEIARGRDTPVLREILDKAAARIDKETNQPAVAAELRSVIGIVYEKIEQYRQAEEMQRAALAFCREHFGTESPEAASALNELGITLIASGKKLEAEQVNREALEIRRQRFGNENADVATSEDNLAHACNDNGEFTEAEALIREALATRRRLFGEESQEVIDSLRNQVLILGSTGKWAEAEAPAREVLTLRRNLLGSQDPSIPGAIYDLAWVARGNGKQNEAAALEKEGFVLRQKVFSDNYQDIADSLYHLGERMRQRGNLEDAYSVLSAALSLFRKFLGDDHPATLHTLSALGLVYEAETNWPESETVFRQVLASWRKQSGDGDPETLNAMRSLAGALEDQGKWAEAETLHRGALASWRKRLGNDDAQTLWECAGLYHDLISQRKYDAAEQLLAGVLTPAFIKKPACSSTLVHRLDLMGRQGRWKEAEADADLILKYQPTDHYSCHIPAGLLAITRNRADYEQLCQRIEPNGLLGIASLSAYLLNPWAWVQFAHNQMAALVTGAFVVAALGAFYTLRGLHPTQARLYLSAGTFAGLIASLLVAFPSGDQQAKMVGRHQPVTLAAMEGKFQGGTEAGVALIGEPNVAARRLDNPIEVPGALSFLAYGHFGSYVHGLEEYPKEAWPDNIELLYYSFHIMITLGTIFILLMGVATLQNCLGGLQSSRLLLWALMLAFPFPYIANTLGWMTAELGRQPWLIYGLFHTREGYSQVVSNGNTIFTLIGFTGLYFVLGLLFLFLVGREIGHGPLETVPAIASWRNARRRPREESLPNNGNNLASNNGEVAGTVKERSQ